MLFRSVSVQVRMECLYKDVAADVLSIHRRSDSQAPITPRRLCHGPEVRVLNAITCCDVLGLLHNSSNALEERSRGQRSGIAVPEVHGKGQAGRELGCRRDYPRLPQSPRPPRTATGFIEGVRGDWMSLRAGNENRCYGRTVLAQMFDGNFDNLRSSTGTYTVTRPLPAWTKRRAKCREHQSVRSNRLPAHLLIARSCRR